MKTNLFKLGNAKGVVSTLMAVVCLLFALPQEMKAEMQTVGPFTAASDNAWKTGFNTEAYPYMSITTLSNDASVKNGDERYLAPQGTSANNNGSVTFKVSDDYIYIKSYSFYYYFSGTNQTSGLFGTPKSGVGYIRLGTNTSGTTLASARYGSGNYNSSNGTLNNVSFNMQTPSTPSGIGWSGVRNTPGINKITFNLLIPEVKDKSGLWEETDNSLVKIKAAGGNVTKDYTYNVADYKDEDDFKVTLTKTNGSGVGSSATATIQSVSGTTLTVRFTYTAGSTGAWQEDYSYDLLVESKNEVNEQSFTTHINGSATDQLSANTLAFLISPDQKVNTQYTKEQTVSSNNTVKSILLSSDNTDVAYFDDYDVLHIVGDGSATLTAEQAASDEIAAKTTTFTLNVTKRQVELAYNPAGALYTGKPYENYVSVTNNTTGTFPGLSYSLNTNDYIDINAAATITTKQTPGNTTLTITSPETDEWEATNINKTVEVVKDPASLDICLTQDVYKDFIKEESFCQKKTPNGTIAVTDDSPRRLRVGEASDRDKFTSTFEIHFIGIPKDLSFTYTRPTDGFFGGTLGFNAADKNYTLTIQESDEEGTNWTEVYSNSTSGATGATTVNRNLKDSTRRIRITYTGVRYVYFSNFCINAKKDFSVPASATITQSASGFVPVNFELEHSMMKSISVTSTNENFTVLPATLGMSNGLGYGNGIVQLEVSYGGSDISETTTLNFAGIDMDDNPINKSMTVSLVHPAHYVKGTVVVYTGNGKAHIASDNTVPAPSAYVGGGGLVGASATMSTAVLECDHGETDEGDMKTLTLRAIPDDKWFFSEWQDDHGTTLSMENPFVVSAEAKSLESANPTVYTYRALFFKGYKEAPKFLVDDVNMGATKSGISIDGNIELTGDPNGVPRYFLASDVDISFEDVEGHDGEAEYFSKAGNYNAKTRTIPVTFDPSPNKHLTVRTYQAKAIVTATNDEYDESGEPVGKRETVHECLVTVVCHPADAPAFTIPEELDFGSVEAETAWGKVLTMTGVESVVGTPTIEFSHNKDVNNNDIFTLLGYDDGSHSFALLYTYHEGQQGELTATATITAHNYDDVEVSHDVTLKVTAETPQFVVNNLSMGTMVSGDEPISADLPLSNLTGANPSSLTIALSDAPGHEGESAVFSSLAYDELTHAFHITFAPVGAHVNEKAYQAQATISATNLVGTTEVTVLINATVQPSAPSEYEIENSHDFGSLQRNQSAYWNAVLTNISNAGEELPTIAFTGLNAEYFSAEAYDPVNHWFRIKFTPLAVESSCSATATVTVKNFDGIPTEKTIDLTGTCIHAPAASFDVQNADHQSIIGSGYYFGDYNVGDAATRTLYIANIQNMKEGSTPVISITPEGIFTSASYNATTQSFDVTFEAELGMETVQNAVATIMISNNDDQWTNAVVPLSAFVVQAVEYEVRVTDANGNLIEGGETDWVTGLSIANKAANAGCTVTLMRAVTGISAYQEIKNTMTLDLNGKRLSGSTGGSIIYMNGAGKTLTIKDSKSDGRIENINNALSGVLYGVNVNAGSVILHSGTIHVENAGASGHRAVGIQNKVNTEVTINGGKVEVYGYNESYGVLQPSDAKNSVFTMNAGELYTEGYSTIMGVSAYGTLNINGGTIGAKATYRYSHGIHLYASSNATASNCYHGVLNMTGGTINSQCTSDADGSREAYGVYFDFHNTAMGDAVATDGSHANKAAAVGTISNATINTSTLGRYAYGILAYGSYNSLTNTFDIIRINNSTINATANYYYSYGVYATGGVNGTHGAVYFANVELTDCEVNATVTKNHTAYAVYAGASSNTVFKNSQPKYYGEYAGGATVTINSGNYTATTGTTNAFAAVTATRAKTTYDSETSVSAERKLGGNAEGYATLNIHGGTFRANAGTTTARAVSNGGNCTIDGGEFYVTTGTSTAYGLYTISGKLKATGIKVDVTAGTGTAYGVVVDAAAAPTGNQAWTGFTYAGDAELNNLDVTVRTSTSTEARGVFVNSTTNTYTRTAFDNQRTSSGWSDDTYTIYNAVFPGDNKAYASAGKVVINGGKYTVTAATTTAYGVYLAQTSVSGNKLASAAAEGTIKNATFDVKTNGTTSAFGLRSGGNVTVDGCTFNVQPKTTTGYGVYMDNNKATITNTKIDVKGTTTAYALYANASIGTTTGWDYHGEFDLGEGNDIKAAATAGNTAHVLTLIAAKRNIAEGAFAGDYANAATAIIRGGSYKATATGTTTYVLNLSAKQVQGAVSAAPSCTIEGGKFWAKADGGTQGVCTSNGVIGNILIQGGVYNINTYLGNFLAPGYDEVPIESGRAEYSEGYRYEVLPAGPHGTYVCQIGTGTKYKTLEEALAAVTSGQVIHMLANYTLPAGDYVLPSGASLMVPYKDGTGKGASTLIGTAAETTTSATTPVLFRKLTFASGANLTCFGTIETSAQQKANGQYSACVGMASGSYGQIHLEEGSHISLENGSRLNCWGFVTGKGTIDAKRGSTSLEGFQLGDWPGGTNASNLIGNSQKVFPVTHYFYQSIECPITYRPGAKAHGSTHVNVSLIGTVGQDAIALVGTSGSMFIMDDKDMREDTWVMKDYNEETDQCVWTVNSGASIGNLTISISSYNMASKDYDLPITTNMSIVLNYGDMGVGQNTVFFPGSQLIINKEGTAVLNGVNVVAYDVDDWTGTTRYYASYSPTWGTNNPRKSIALKDAEVFVHGKINIKNNGGLYTSAGGANVHSTNEDAGEVIYTTAAQENKTNYFLIQGGTNKTTLTVNPVRLKNGVADPAFSASAGTVAGKRWIYIDDQWQCWTQDEYCMYRDAQDNPYAKPSGYVALNKQEADVDDASLIHDAATGTRGFIWDKDCYWWEVNLTPVGAGIYQSITPDHNGKYNCYEFNENDWWWEIKNVKVTFNGEGVTSTEYTTGYGTKPKWLGATPTKSGYVWDGWQINGAGELYSNDNLPVVTANTTFTSHFKLNPVMYNVTFKNPDGTVLDSRNWENGSTPSYEGTPTQNPTASTIYTWNGTWSPAITTVTAAKEYTAQYNATTREYNVTFLNYDNTELATTSVAYGTTPSYSGTPERIDPTDMYIYTFSGWKNQQTGTTGLGVVNGEQTYVAQYTSKQKYYNVRFMDYNSTTLQTGPVLRETTPATPEDPTRESDMQYNYAFAGWTPSVVAATANATYTATYNSSLRSYTIQFVNYNGDVLQSETLDYGVTPVYKESTPIHEDAGLQFVGWDDIMRTVNGDKTYTAQFDISRHSIQIASNESSYGSVMPSLVIQIPHGSEVSVNNNTFTVNGTTITATPTPATAQYTYTFTGWENLPNEVTADVDNVTAVFTCTTNTYTVTWENADHTPLEVDENVAYGTMPSYDGATPTQEGTAQYAYTFEGWDKTISQVTGDITYTAVYGQSINSYTITWVDGNGETLKAEQVAYGETPAYSGATPLKDATAQYTYTFNNTWTPAIEAVTGEATYTAQFNSTVNNYTLTIAVNEDTYGSINETSVTVPYGSTVTVEGNTFTVNGTTVTATPTSATAQYTYAFVQWNNLPATVTGNVDNVEAEFSSTLNTYLITWLNDDDSQIDQTMVAYGVVPTHADATKANTKDYTYVFLGWDNTPVAVTGEATYKATYKTIPLRIEVNGGDDEIVDVTTTVTTTIVHEDGDLNVTGGNTLTTDDLILEGTPTTSGEITGAGTIDAGRALFHYSQSGGFKARTWYAVAVPWQVDVPAYALGGVYLKKGEGTYVQQTLGSTFDLIYYNGELRATGATKAWNYVENDDADKQIMIPGRAYMIYLTTDADTIRFERKAGTALHTSALETHKYGSDMGANFADWNGIANPATYHAYLNVGATENQGQVYNPDTKQYELFDMSAQKLVVGQPIFVQPKTAKTVVASDSYGTYSPAPRRARAEEAMVRYELYLAPSMDVASDRIIVRMDEEKEEDEYVVGQDLAKMGVSSLVPQMWINRYDSKMCINTVAPMNNKANYPLGISVPQNGEYDIFIDDEQDGESTLYLTYDGKAIWNLTLSSYVANLEKGTNTHYGLRIVRKAPTVVTDIEEATILNGDVVRKVIIEDKVFIIRNGEMYSVTGQKAQ